MRRSKMAWSNNVRLFLKLSTQRCQFLSGGSKSEAPGGQKPGIFESDVLASTSNARHMECLFAKWIRDNNSIHGTWQHFFKELVKEQVDTAMTTPKLYHPKPNDPHLSGKTDLYENLARHIHAPSLSNQEMSFQEKTKYSTSNVGSMDNRSDKVNFSVPVTSPTISPPVLKDPSSTAKSDLNTCVVRPQKEDMEVLSLSTDIRTSGIYDHTKIGRKIPCFVLTAKGVADPFSKNMTRRMSQKKPPKEPVQSSLTAERSKRSKNRRNKFQKRYNSFETFLKYWKQASKREKFRRHNGPVMVVKKRSTGNSKPNNTMCFKSYYEKRPNQRKEKVPETISKQEIKVPSKPKEDKPKDQPELDPMKCNKNPLNASQVEDEDKDVKARDNALKTIETAKESTMVSEESRNTRIPKNKSDTYETLEDLIDDIDDNTLNENSTDSIQPEKAKFVESASKKMPVQYKTSLRVFRPKENVKPKAVDQSLDVKQKPALKSKKPNSNKPVPETFRPLRVFNADQKVIPKDEDKSWIYWDELTVKSLRKPTPGKEKSTSKSTSSKNSKDLK